MPNLTSNTTLALRGEAPVGKLPLGSNMHTVYAYGTWGGGTLTVQVAFDDSGTWFDTDATLTANNFVTISGRFTAIRASLAGATGPSLQVGIV